MRATAPLILAVTPVFAAPDLVSSSDWLGPSIRDWVLLVPVLVLLVMWLWRRKQRYPKQRPYAYLYRLAGLKLVKSEITTTVFRIGRHPNNELRLNHRAVSRFHAEIVRNKNGSFTIYDAQSKNGIRVGMRPVNSSSLKEGEIIDIASARFRFSKFPRDYNTFRHTDMIDVKPDRFRRRRRRDGRKDMVMHVRVYHDESGWINGRVRDLSPQGAFIEMDKHILPRAPVDIVLPIVHGTSQRWFRLSGEVVRENKHGVGILFHELDESAAQMLQTLSHAA